MQEIKKRKDVRRSLKEVQKVFENQTLQANLMMTKGTAYLNFVNLVRTNKLFDKGMCFFVRGLCADFLRKNEANSYNGVPLQLLMAQDDSSTVDEFLSKMQFNDMEFAELPSVLAVANLFNVSVDVFMMNPELHVSSISKESVLPCRDQFRKSSCKFDLNGSALRLLLVNKHYYPIYEEYQAKEIMDIAKETDEGNI